MVDKDVIISVYRDNLNYFDEEGRCDICGKDMIPCKEIITTDQDDALVSDTWYCFECYKDMMKKFNDTDEELKKMFRPEWVHDGQTNKWRNVEK